MVSGQMPKAMEEADRASKRAIVDAYSHLIVRSLPRIPLTHREFAEKYVRLATGPYRGEPFRVSRQPFVGVLFDEFDACRFSTIFATGPSQSSKTLSAFVIPTLRDIVELREDVIIGVPEADMASDKWDRDFVPTLRESPQLSWLLPSKGPGSRGGVVKDRITMGNGVMVKIITRGGQDTAKAGYTSSRVRVTEAAGWSHSSDTSVEADNLRQLVARMRAFKRSQRSLIVEGTTTVEDELPWRARGSDDDERIISTRSRLVVPCEQCEAWICPEREHLVGWQDAETEQQAADQACWLCPSCGAAMRDEQRRAANAEVRLLHHGQVIDRNGRVVGDVPPTSTLWFRWNAFNNCLLDAADTAVDEWKAAQLEEGTADRENAEKELCQFSHAIPFRSSLTENETLRPETLRRRTESWPKNVLPADTKAVTIGVDIGDWTAWWLAIAWRANGQAHIPAYGAFDVKREDSDDLAQRIVHSLTEFRELIGEQGFASETGGYLLPSAVWIDIGYQPDAVAAFIRSSGKFWQNRYKGCRGRGASVKGNYTQPKRVSTDKPKVGVQWFAELNLKRRIPEFTFNADYWKLYAQARLRGLVGTGNACSLYQPTTKNEHAKLSHHLCSEQLAKEWDPAKGLVEKWKKTGQNHWLDCMAMACAAGNFAGCGDIEPTQAADMPKPLPATKVLSEQATNFWAAMAKR